MYTNSRQCLKNIQHGKDHNGKLTTTIPKKYREIRYFCSLRHLPWPMSLTRVPFKILRMFNFKLLYPSHQQFLLAFTGNYGRIVMLVDYEAQIHLKARNSYQYVSDMDTLPIRTHNLQYPLYFNVVKFGYVGIRFGYGIHVGHIWRLICNIKLNFNLCFQIIGEVNIKHY